MSFLRSLLGRGAREEHPPSQSAAISPRSKAIVELRALLDRRRERGETPQILLVGPPSGSVIEVLNGWGARVTVDSEEPPRPPLAHDDGVFDVVLAFELLDYVEDEPAAALIAEWARVLRAGGRVFLIARPPGPRVALRHRAEGASGGVIELVTRGETRVPFHGRGNAEWLRISGPLSVDEVLLRRDGLREICLKKI